MASLNEASSISSLSQGEAIASRDRQLVLRFLGFFLGMNSLQGKTRELLAEGEI